MTYGTMEKIETVTVTGATAASIVFSNIPQTYSDLLVKISARLTFNASTASLGAFLNTAAADTSYRWIRGNGSVAASGNDAARNDFYLGEVNADLSTSSVFSSYDLYIPNYTGLTQKSLSADGVSENNATIAYQYLSAGLCTKTAAVTSVTIRGFEGTGSLVQHSTATLYGITRVPAGAKATGGIITDDASYWYHIFTSSGTFTPSQNLNDVEYIVVAGGGGGGENAGSPGGAGGYRSSVIGEMSGGGASAQSRISMSSGTSYTVTIGAGGAGNSVPNGGRSRGSQGSSSSLSGSGISTISCTGGGYGTSNGFPIPSDGGNGGSGGSGGAGAAYGGGDTFGSGGSGTPGEGFGGGSATASGQALVIGGGGGAGSAGQSVNQSNAGQVYYAGNGGIGVSTIMATATGYGDSGYFAGGGIGGDGTNGVRGLGGGGAAGQAGFTNTGGGGGSSSSGGSGIVIVRYAK